MATEYRPEQTISTSTVHCGLLQLWRAPFLLARNNGQVLGCFDERWAAIMASLIFSSTWAQPLIEKHSSLSMEVPHRHEISKTTRQHSKKPHSTSQVLFSLHLFTKCFTLATMMGWMTGSYLIFLKKPTLSPHAGRHSWSEGSLLRVEGPTSTKHYFLNDTYKAFEQAHDNLVRQKMLAHDENVREF